MDDLGIVYRIKTPYGRIQKPDLILLGTENAQVDSLFARRGERSESMAESVEKETASDSTSESVRPYDFGKSYDL